MLTHYLRQSLRSLRRREGYALLNLVGLAVGLAGCLFMALFVWSELTVDRFHADADRVVRVVQEGPDGGSAQTAGAHAAVLAQSAADVETTVRIAPWERTLTADSPGTGAHTALAEPHFAYADPTLFDVFSLPLAAGDPETALERPGTAVLTRATAARYFGTADPVGRTLVMIDEYSEPSEIPLVVTGVLADLPGRSHLTLGVLSSTATLERQYGPLDKLDWPGLYTYARLADGVDRGATARRATGALAARLQGGAGPQPTLRLQPLTEIYLDPQPRDEWGATGSRDAVFGLAAIALVVLLLACTNVTTLTLARATTRVREVGIRRALGAHRAQVVAQFLTDTLVLTAAALVLAVVLTVVGAPVVSAAVGHPLGLGAGSWGVAALALAGLLVLTGVVAGVSPALFLARQRPASAVRGQAGGVAGATRLRSGLVVVQFGASTVLIVMALVIHRQLDYVSQLDPGFDAERVVAITADDARRSFEPLREALAAEPGVLAVSAVNGLPALQEVQTDMVARPPGRDDADAPVQVQAVGPGFFDLMGVDLRAGRYPADTPTGGADRSLVLNETAAEALGWAPEAALGQRVQVVQPGNEANNPGFGGTVSAVVADFHHASARTAVPPAVYYPARSADVSDLYVISHVLVKIAPGAEPQTLRRIEKAWGGVVPDRPFEAAFLSGQIQSQYERDVRLGQAVGLFAGLALVVAGLGLFGLAAFAAERRTVEVAVRKALGARAGDLVALLTREALSLVAVALVVAAPLAYLAAGRWLDGFAHRVTLGPGPFLVAAASLAALMLLAVTGHAVRAATADPVRALRSE